MAYDTRTPAKRRVARILSAVSVLGLLLAAAALVQLIRGAGEIADSRFTAGGGTRTVALEADDYDIRVEGVSQTYNSGNCDAADAFKTVARYRIRMMGSGGETLDLREPSECKTSSNDNAAVAAVSITDAGKYTLTATQPKGSPPASIYLAPPNTQSVWFMALFAGLFLSVGAFMLKIFRF